MKTTKLILYILLSFVLNTTYAQTQHGIVKTRGCMVNGKLQSGKGLADATVDLKDRSAVVSKDDGTFSFPLRTRTYLVKKVTKKGYQLVDIESLRERQYSAAPVYLVEQQRADLLAAERKIRRNLQRQLQEQEDEIVSLKVSQQEKDSLLRILFQQQGDNERLIADMSKRYSTLDYDQFDEFYRQVNYFIENGELTRADSLLRTRGDINAQVQGIIQQGQAIQEHKKQIQKAEAVHQTDIDEAARRCYGYYETFLAQHQNDSAVYYLELRAALDTTNIEWQNRAGWFVDTYLADYEKARSYYERCLRQTLLQGGENDEWVATSYNNIGSVYNSQGDYANALGYHLKALAIWEKVVGTEHPSVATSYNNIGLVYLNHGNFAKALECYRKALSIQERIFGVEHPDVATSYSNIGGVYDGQGDYGKALECLRKALSIQESVLDVDHLDVARSYNNIGNVYDEQGDYGKALECYQKTLAINEKVLGMQHPNVATSYNNIGLVYYNQRDYAKALEYYQKAFAIWERVRGTDHPDVAPSYNDIGLVYDSQGNYTKALEYLLKALSIQESILGTAHPDVALTNENIGGVYGSLGDYTMNLEYLQKAFDVYESVLGSEHPNTKNVHENIMSIKRNLIISNPEAMKSHVFIATTIDVYTPAKQQGLNGEYVILEFADWTIDSSKSLFEKNEEMQGKPKTIVLMKDGNISQHHFENIIGVRLGLKEVGKEAKEETVANYHGWKINVFDK